MAHVRTQDIEKPAFIDFRSRLAAIKAPPRSKGARYSPFLAVALSKGHKDLAVWMITQKGCKRSDLDPDTGSRCRELASPDLLEEVEAEVQRIAMRGDREIRAGKPGEGSIRA